VTPRLSAAAVRAWLVSRAVVLALVALATYLQVRHGYGNPPARPGATGLYAWDGGWYRDIAAHGYRGAGRESLRFFPLYPLLSRLLTPLVVANVSALLYAEGLVRLAGHEWPSAPGVAARSAWLGLVNPASYVLVLAYAEATAAALAVWCVYALCRRSWWLAALLALLAGLARPIGPLLAVPALVEAWPGHRAAWRSLGGPEVAARVAAVGAAPLGTALYLGWSRVAYGDALLPFRVQREGDLRGGLVTWPGRALGTAWRALLAGGPVPTALHLLWVPLAVGGLVLVARRLPASYAAYTAAVLVLAVGTPRLASFERYALAAFPLVLVAAGVRSRLGRVTVGVACGLGLAGYSMLALTARYVP
jgi:hypothetical protein